MYYFHFTSRVFAVLCVGYQSIPASRARSHTVFYTVHRGCQEKRCAEHSHFQVERLPEVKKMFIHYTQICNISSGI